MDALIQGLADIDSKDNERRVPPDPNACQICNDCSGWQNESVRPQARTFKLDKWPTPGFEIRTDLKSLVNAAKDGCPSCSAFSCAIRGFLPSAKDDVEVKGWLPMPSGSLPVLWVKEKVEGADESGFKFEFFTTQENPSPWAIFRPGKLVPEDTSSDESFRRAQQWLNDCLENHPQCQLHTEPESELPTRILDVGAPDTKDPQVKLYETHGRKAPYIALSHCWGKSQMIKTEHSSIDARKRGIPWDQLPKSFQHAITFIRRLGIQYLWIDSLCIVQDDQADWEKESSKMASIYANALLTLAATKSADSTGGCFSNVPENGRTREITSLDQNGTPITVYARPLIQNWEKSPLPLYKRAWCFQERILSLRTLHFEYCELYWECKTMSSYESSLTPTYKSNQTTNGLGREADPHSMNDRWRKLLKEYVELDLTYETDRLPALSGLAKSIQTTYGRGRYLAGLWEDSLLEDLMWWVREEDAYDTRRPIEWRAPSWSWASIEGKIMHRILPIKVKHCEVVDVQVDAAGADPNGAVAFARLMLEGILVTATLRVFRPKSEAEGKETGNRPFRIEFAGMIEAGPHRIYVDYELDRSGYGQVFDGHEVCCFCIATDQWHKCWLVLRQMGDVYERIGMAWQNSREIKDHGDWENFGGKKTVVTVV